MSRRPLLASLALLCPLLALTAAPVPRAVKALPPPSEEELEESRHNLRQISQAMLSYEDACGAMPNNVVDGDGKPLLSWRVLLLPYMEEGALYQKFVQKEAWDGEGNLPLVEKMPKVFRPVRVKATGAGVTFYRGFTGDDAVFETGKKVAIARIADGSSYTLAVVEAGEPCVWTKPDDLPFDAKKPLPKLGGLFDGDFHMAMCDGGVRLGSRNSRPEQVKKAITRSGGELFDLDAVFPQAAAK